MKNALTFIWGTMYWVGRIALFLASWVVMYWVAMLVLFLASWVVMYRVPDQLYSYVALVILSFVLGSFLFVAVLNLLSPLFVRMDKFLKNNRYINDDEK
jgi:hypothetical protein